MTEEQAQALLLSTLLFFIILMTLIYFNKEAILNFIHWVLKFR